MKQLLLILLIISATNTFATKKPWDNGKITVSEDGKFLMHENGTPLFLLGNTAWLMPQRLDRDEAAYFLKRCAEAEYNFVKIQVLNGIPSFNTYGQPSHHDNELVTGSAQNMYTYWDHIDYIIDTAERYGIYIGMVCVWGGIVKSGALNVEQAKEYGAFLANRYKEKKNVIWVIGGDIQGSIKTDVWQALAMTIKSIDKNHVMTFHPRGRTTSAKWWKDAEWIDFHEFQSGHRRYNQRMGNKDYPIVEGTEEDNWMYVDSTWKEKPIRPVIDGEPSYEDIPKGLHDEDEPHWTASDVRRYAYWSVFAGSCGHVYGHNNIMQFARPGVGGSYFADGEKKPWYKALDDEGFNQMKYVKHLIMSFPYFERIPDQSVILDNGTQYERLIATRGTDYLLVYNCTARSMAIDISSISGKKKDVWWMDAATGDLTYIGETSSGQYEYTPDNGDGVLIIVDAGKGYIGRSQASIIKGVEPEEKDRTE